MINMHFTKAAIDALPAPPKGRTYARDDLVHNLTLTVTPAGTRTFYLSRFIRGRSDRIKLGRYPALTIAKARARARELDGRIESGHDPKAMNEETTLGDLWEHFYTHHVSARRKPKTAVSYQHAWDRHLRQWATRPLSEITKADVVRLHAQIGRTAPYAANRAAAVLSSMYSHASRRMGFEGGNPATSIERFDETKRDRFLRADELERFFIALDELPSETMRDFFLTLLYTGARRRNVEAMRWDQVDLDRRLWRIPDTKGGGPQDVHLPAPLVEVLSARRASRNGQPWVFQSSERTGHITQPDKSWRRVLKLMAQYTIEDYLARGEAEAVERFKPALVDVADGERSPADVAADAGLREKSARRAVAMNLHIDPPVVPHIRMHDLRRTLGSWQAATGASLPIIGKALGHRDQATTAIYARLDIDPVRKSVDTAVAAIRAAAGVDRVEKDILARIG